MEEQVEYQRDDNGIESWLVENDGDTWAHARVRIAEEQVPEEKRPLYFHTRVSCTHALPNTPGGCRKKAAREAAVQFVERALSELTRLGFEEYSKVMMEDLDS